MIVLGCHFQEMKENEDFELVEGEVLHYNDF